MAVTVGILKELTIGGPRGKTSTFILTSTSLCVKREGDTQWPEIVVPLRYVLWAEVADGFMEVSLLAKRGENKGYFVIVHITGQIRDQEHATVLDFTEALMSAAYQGVKRNRHVLVLVNPASGPGKSVRWFWKKVEPLFRAARCTTDVTFTTHPKHATEVAKDLPLDKYDAIATMSGDGLIHEVLNGFAKHADPIRAFRTPVAPIPTGSGNGTALNLLGLQEGADISAAALNIVKGFPMSTDVFSVTQGDNRVVSYMSQAIGLMAELDLGTEHLRFMGDKRFMYGFLRGVVQHRSCPVKVSIKVVESNKRKMISDLHSARSEATNRIKSLHRQPLQDVATDGGPKDTPSHESTAAHTSSLPPLVHRDQPQGEGWIVFDKRFMFLYAGKGPFVSRDLMQFPVSHPDDGFIDVVIQEQTTRKGMLQGIDGAETGKNYWLETQHYFKAEAYRVEPHASDSYLSVDGERYPFEPYQVEVHRGLATLLSPYGSYNAEFSLPE